VPGSAKCSSEITFANFDRNLINRRLKALQYMPRSARTAATAVERLRASPLREKMTAGRVTRRIMLVGVLAVSLFAGNVAGTETLTMTCTQYAAAANTPQRAGLRAQLGW
jgi:hypothetical protein